MVLMHSENRTNVRLLAIKKLSFMAFLVASSYGAFATAWPILLKEVIVNRAKIGFFTAGLSMLGLIFLISLVPLIRKFKPKKLYFISLISTSILFLFHVYVNNLYTFLIIAILNMLFMTVQIQCFGILIRDHSSLKNINRNENLIFILGNCGWLIGPLASSWIVANYGVNLVFVMASLFLLVGAHIFAFTKTTEHKSTEEKLNIFKNLITFIKKKKLRKVYFLNAGLEIWWCLPFIFVPLEILRTGYASKYIGLFLFLVIVPLIFTEISLKKMNQRFSEKGLLIIGYSILVLSASACFFANNIFQIALFIISGSFGLALIEFNVESLFFKTIKKLEGEKFYGPFTTAKTAGSFIGKLGIAFCLSFFTFKYIFVFMFFVMISLMTLATQIKK